jgi:LysM repeat protein
VFAATLGAIRGGRRGKVRIGASALCALFCAWASACRQEPPLILPMPGPPLLPTVAYRVKPGDTLERVAAWHGAAAGDVAESNGLAADAALEPGRTLQIPARALPAYALQYGDTLGRLARWYGVEVDDLVRLNDVSDPRRLETGHVLRIPANAQRSDPPPPPAPVAETAVLAQQPEVDGALGQASTRFEEADFEGSLASAERARSLLPAAPETAGERRLLARGYLLGGMAEVALGRDEEARASFRRAVALDPGIDLDSARVSPRILSVFREARGR